MVVVLPFIIIPIIFVVLHQPKVNEKRILLYVYDFIHYFSLTVCIVNLRLNPLIVNQHQYSSTLAQTVTGNLLTILVILDPIFIMRNKNMRKIYIGIKLIQ